MRDCLFIPAPSPQAIDGCVRCGHISTRFSMEVFAPTGEYVKSFFLARRESITVREQASSLLRMGLRSWLDVPESRGRKQKGDDQV
jgi:hypothetical protein